MGEGRKGNYDKRRKRKQMEKNGGTPEILWSNGWVRLAVASGGRLPHNWTANVGTEGVQALALGGGTTGLHPGQNG